MAIYKFDGLALTPLERTTFAKEGVMERTALQRTLREHIDVIAPDTLVIAEEFGQWDESRRRIDLLGVDKDANLVVIELKRTEEGGHMELQSLRYAAMVANLTFEQSVEIYEHYIEATGKELDARDALLDFLGWEEANEDAFAQDVRIVLASADFSKEVTTSVLWLNEHGLDIRCVRLRPYQDDGRILLDVQQFIPLPEAEEYQVRVRNKVSAERAARTQSRDLTKYTLTLAGTTFERLPKRWAIFRVIKYLCEQGVDPEAIRALIPWRPHALRWIEGRLSSHEFSAALALQLEKEGRQPQPERFFIADDELIHSAGRTYAVTKMWGAQTGNALEGLKAAYEEMGLSVVVAE